MSNVFKIPCENVPRIKDCLAERPLFMGVREGEFERRGVLPRRGEDEIQIDWLLILLGPFDERQGVRHGGLVDQVKEVVEFVKLSRRIDSWLVRGIAVLALVKWFGIDHVTDIFKLFAGGHAS